MFARASAFAEVIELLDVQKLQNGIEAMTRNIKNEDKNFQIGGSEDARHKRKNPTTTRKGSI